MHTSNVKLSNTPLKCACPGVHGHVNYLKELGADFKLWWLAAGLLGTFLPVLDSLKELMNGPRDDSLLLLAKTQIEARSHGVGLPRTRLKPHFRNNSKLPFTV